MIVMAAATIKPSSAFLSRFSSLRSFFCWHSRGLALVRAVQTLATVLRSSSLDLPAKKRDLRASHPLGNRALLL